MGFLIAFDCGIFVAGFITGILVWDRYYNRKVRQFLVKLGKDPDIWDLNA